MGEQDTRFNQIRELSLNIMKAADLASAAFGITSMSSRLFFSPDLRLQRERDRGTSQRGHLAARLFPSNWRGGVLISQAAFVLSNRIGEGMETWEIEVKGVAEPLEVHVMRVES